MKKLYASAALLLAAIIWGFAFVAQTVGMDHVGPFTFQSSRYLLGALTLVPVILVSDSRKKKAGTYRKMTQAEKKTLLKGGLACGVVMTFAASFQQVGLAYTTVGKSGFITSMYIILVPVFGLFLHKRVPAKIWGCVVVAAVGFYFLSINGPLELSRGDTLTVLCSLCFCFHILCVDHFVSLTDAIKLSFLQLLTTGVISGIIMFLFEQPTWSAIQGALPAILYAGILSCGVAYTLQVCGAAVRRPYGGDPAHEPGIGVLRPGRYPAAEPGAHQPRVPRLHPHLRRSAHLPAAHFGGETDGGILIAKESCVKEHSHSFLFVYRAVTGFQPVTSSAFSFWSERCRSPRQR